MSIIKYLLLFFIIINSNKMTQLFVEIQNLVKPIKSYDWITKTIYM